MGATRNHRAGRGVGRWMGLLVTALTALGALAVSAAPVAAAPSSTSPAPTSSPTVLLVDGSVPLTRYQPHTTTWPDGTPAAPYPTIGSAVAGAQWLRKQGQAARIVIAPGVYRETIDIGWAGDAAPPLVIEPQQPGTVVVSGADVETRLTPVSGTRFVAAPWSERWGLAPVPSSWAGVQVPEMVRRRELVLVDGLPLRQVVDRASLAPGTFTVEESAGRIVIDPPAGLTGLAEREVEVARRPHALRIRGLARSVTVRGLVFEAAAASFTSYMAYVTDATDIVLEGNTFRHSSGGGLGLSTVTRATVRGNRAEANGLNGIDTNRVTDLVMEGNHITSSNVRGHQNGFVGWATAGSKNLLLHGALFRGNTYEGNLARGLWFDTDVADVRIEGDRSCENQGDGVFIEAVQGPLTIVDTTFCDNDRAGVLVGTSGRVTIESSILTGNDYGQIVFAGQRRRSWTDHVTGALVTMGDFADWRLRDTTLASDGAAPLIYSPVIPIADWRALLGGGELVASGTAMHRPSATDALKIQATDFALADWNRLTGDSAVLDANGLDTDGLEARTRITPTTPDEPVGELTEPGTTPSTGGSGTGTGNLVDQVLGWLLRLG